MKPSNPIDRRRFLSLMGTGIAVGAAASVGLANPAMANAPVAVGAGRDLSGWETILGNGLYAAKDQAAVSAADIAAEHLGNHSRLRANVANRGVMAHVLSYKRVTDESMMNVVHRAGFSFRVPFVPSPSDEPLNAQTVEGGLFVWDGADTRVDHGTAFQWVINPWMANFGQILVWSDAGGGSWTPGGFLTPDTEWHTVTFRVDPVREAVTLSIDGNNLAVSYSRTPKWGWGTDVSARLQAEAISVWPGATATWAPQHEVLVRDWSWTQQTVKSAPGKSKKQGGKA